MEDRIVSMLFDLRDAMSETWKEKYPNGNLPDRVGWALMEALRVFRGGKPDRGETRVTELETELELLRAGANKLGPENRRLKAELQAERDLANRNADEMERMRQEIRLSRAGLKKVQELALIVDAAVPGEIDAGPVLEDLLEALKTAGLPAPFGDSSADTGKK